MSFSHGALWVLISELDLHYLSEAKSGFEFGVLCYWWDG